MTPTLQRLPITISATAPSASTWRWSIGERLREGAHGPRHARLREHDVDNDRQLRFQAAHKAPGSSLESVYVADNQSRICKQALAVADYHRLSGRPIEQLKAELSFHVGDHLGDHRLRFAKLAARSGETAIVHCGHKHAVGSVCWSRRLGRRL
jgi:hypothetical protein